MGLWPDYLLLLGIPASELVMFYIHQQKMRKLNEEYHKIFVYVEDFGHLGSEGLIPHPNLFSGFSEQEYLFLLFNFRDLESNQRLYIYGHPVFASPGRFCQNHQFWDGRYVLPNNYY